LIWVGEEKKSQEGRSTLPGFVSDDCDAISYPDHHHDRFHEHHKEIRRRTKVVGIFPDQAAVIRLVGSIMKETDDEWRGSRRYFQQERLTLLFDWEPSQIDKPASYLGTMTMDLSLEANNKLHL
jgi:hypothetical protein